jgi:hypothetical protein
LAIPPIKLKLELHIRGGLLIENDLDQSLWSTIRNTDPQSGAIYYTLFGSCTTVLRHLPAAASCTNLVQKNQFPELNRNILTYSQ